MKNAMPITDSLLFWATQYIILAIRVWATTLNDRKNNVVTWCTVDSQSESTHLLCRPVRR